MLSLISRGINTDSALDKATGRDPEHVARTLGALQRRGLIIRRFADGSMRYFVK
jgi:predicted transcriptional regulator